MHRLKLIIMPKDRGSILKAVRTGVNMGVIMMMAALASISMPIIKKSRFSSRRMITRLSVIAVKISSNN